jgi:hypothetical protein
MRQAAWAASLLLVIGLCFVETGAQQQRPRNRRSRRLTNPVPSATRPAPQPTPSSSSPTTPTTTNGDARIISTANDPLTDDLEAGDPPPAPARRTNRSRGSSNTATAEPEQDGMRRTVNRLSRQVDQLSTKLTQIEGQQRALVDLERLSRAEQRAEAFRAQLRDVYAKEADLQARLDQLEYDIKPENIERSTAFYGTTRPDEAREARRRQLESERTRVQSQLNLLATSRTRLESAIALADTEVERLRARLDASEQNPQPQPGNDNATNDSEPTDSSDAATRPTRPAPDTPTTGTP